jgi:hypothetical protein
VEAVVKYTHIWFYEHPFYEFSFENVKVPVHAMKAYRGSRCISPFFSWTLDGSEWTTSRG